MKEERSRAREGKRWKVGRWNFGREVCAAQQPPGGCGAEEQRWWKELRRPCSDVTYCPSGSADSVPPFLRELLFPLENFPRVMNEVPRAVTVVVSQSNFSRWERNRLIFRLFLFFFLSLLFRVAWELRKLFRSCRAVRFPQQKSTNSRIWLDFFF